MRSHLSNKNKYEGFSLVEMLITLVIIGMVMLIAGTTLTTLIKVSSVSANKTRVRTESEFVLELVRRTVRNSDPSDVYIFSSGNVRKYNPDTNKIENIDDESMIEAAYTATLGEDLNGNEIHFRPYGYESWMCIAYFPSTKDENVGYILKTSAKDLRDAHANCFDPASTQYIIALNSDSVDIDSFDISYTVLQDNNYLIKFNVKAEPTHWYLGENNKLVNRAIDRQAVVSTEGIIW